MANTLFPPIIDSWMPAFVNECNIYFTLSNYNSLNSIAGIQLSIRNAKSNKSALTKKIYTAEVKNILRDNIKQDGDKYYVTINVSDIEGGFTIDQFYKIQLRFIDISVGSIEDAPTVNWLDLHQQAFSEWSRVCLIKPISEPSLNIFGLEENAEVIIQDEFTTISGTLDFSVAEEDEFLKQYKVTIYENSIMTPYFQSDIIEVAEYNTNFINYILPIDLYNSKKYQIEITIYTNNGYVKTYSYGINLNIHTGADLDISAFASADESNGSIIINLSPGQGGLAQLLTSRLLIRRSSSNTNFKIWEDVQGQMGVLEWRDFTVKSGECYRYQIQQVDAQGNRGTSVLVRNSNKLSPLDDYTIKVDFEDTYLLDSTLQMRVKFDPDIASYKHNILESKIDTIGSKYPFIKRNGYVDYRTFSISGLISYESDEKGEFISKKDLFREGIIDFYDDVINDNSYETSIGYIAINDTKENDGSVMDHADTIDAVAAVGIGKHGDYIYEREFREKIIEFLYNSKIKLFRSLTEGNILVKLMDVSLTPNKTLGRLVYSFSATAHEIAEATIENYLENGLLNIPDMTELKVEDTTGVVGQLYGIYSGNLINALEEKYKYYNLTNNSSSIYKVDSLGWMRIAFYSDAYQIYSANGVPTPVLSTSNVNEDDIMYGHIVYINGNAIMLKTDEELEIPFRDKSISSVSLPEGRNEEIIFDYQVNIYLQDKSSESNIKSRTYNQIVGQLYESFEENVSYYAKIYNKYRVNKSTWYQKILNITNLRLQIPKNIDIYYMLYPKETNLQYNSWMGPIVSGSIQNEYEKESPSQNIWWSKDGNTINFKPGAVKDIKFVRRKSSPQTVFTETATDEYGNEYKVVDVDKYYIVPEDEGGVFNNKLRHVTVKAREDGVLKEKYLVAVTGGEERYIDLPSIVYNLDTLTQLRDVYQPIKILNAQDNTEQLLLDEEDGRPIMVFKRKEPLLIPHEHYVYTINGEQFIYFEGEWYPFDQETSIILSKIDGIIDYTLDLEKGVYV